MRTIPQTLTSLVLALTCSLASASPKDELHEAFGKFLKLHSFRASATDVKNHAPVSSVDFVAPDRYRVKPTQGPPSVIIGDTMYIDMNGKLTPMPVPGVGKMVAQYRNENFLHEIEGGMSVQALPDESVDGETAKVYAYTLTQPIKSEAKAWVSQKSGMPMQIESTGTVMGHTTTTRVRYSNFDDPSIKVDAPN
jgi:outer membrane lipoprotein-sorting protein